MVMGTSRIFMSLRKITIKIAKCSGFYLQIRRLYSYVLSIRMKRYASTLCDLSPRARHIYEELVKEFDAKEQKK